MRDKMMNIIYTQEQEIKYGASNLQSHSSTVLFHLYTWSSSMPLIAEPANLQSRISMAEEAILVTIED
jgi:hypothetical protein